MDTIGLTIADAGDQLRAGRLQCADLTAACLRQIERLNPRLNAFITLAQSGPQGQTDGLLAGIPLAIKDLYDTRGVRTTAGTLFFKENIPSTDAAVVEKLYAAGAYSVGKANTHEIALGLTNVNPHYGPCRNPWDETRVSGGSSGGSAVAVASGMALGAVGTDTGGSIRVPAALCGIVGLKPTYGRVSLRGVLPLAWSLDHAGPLTKTVADAARMLQVIAGFDEADPASADVPVDDYGAALEDGIRGWKVGLACGEYIEDADPEVLNAVREAGRMIAAAGAQVREIRTDWLRDAALANGIIVLSEAAAFHHARLASQSEMFGDDVRQRLQMGAAYTSGDYARARRTQVESGREAKALFEDVDVLILPTTPTIAPLIEGTDALEQARRLTRFTAPFNLTGVPAISIPCGYRTSGVLNDPADTEATVKPPEVSLPIGLQLVCGSWQEAKLLRAAGAAEQALRGVTRALQL